MVCQLAHGAWSAGAPKKQRADDGRPPYRGVNGSERGHILGRYGEQVDPALIPVRDDENPHRTVPISSRTQRRSPFRQQPIEAAARIHRHAVRISGGDKLRNHPGCLADDLKPHRLVSLPVHLKEGVGTLARLRAVAEIDGGVTIERRAERPIALWTEAGENLRRIVPLLIPNAPPGKKASPQPAHGPPNTATSWPHPTPPTRATKSAPG